MAKIPLIREYLARRLTLLEMDVAGGIGGSAGASSSRSSGLGLLIRLLEQEASGTDLKFVLPMQSDVLKGIQAALAGQRRVVLLLGGVYLGVFLVLLALERWLIFHPTAYPADWREPPSALHAQDVWLSLTDQTRIHAWWCPAEGWKPAKGAVLYAHGNAGIFRLEGFRDPLCDRMMRWTSSCRR